MMLDTSEDAHTFTIYARSPAGRSFARIGTKIKDICADALRFGESVFLKSRRRIVRGFFFLSFFL